VRLQRRAVAARVSLFATAVAIAAVLSACTAGEPTAISSSGSAPATAATPKAGATPTPTPTIEAVLVVSSVDVDGKNVSSSGYVQGLVEDGGTCVFTYARAGATTVTAQREAVADRMTTSCGLVQSPIDRFVRGSWSVTLSYEHDGTTYTSVPATVEVP
jgi:hypothetical protein